MLERKFGCGCGLCRRSWVWRAAVDCGGEVWLGVRLDCADEGWIGARLWIVSARLGLWRGCELCWQGLDLGAAVNCVGEVGLGARRGLCRRG